MREFVRPLLLLTLLGACTHSSDQDEKSGPPVVLDASATVVPAQNSPLLLQKIAFGSCNRQNLPQPMWRKLVEEKPDLWIWTGDVIYANTDDMGQLSRLYAQQLNQPEYNRFLTSGPAVIGIYDDHEYGKNDSGIDTPMKKPSMQLFLDFVNEPKQSPRRQQPGIYTSYRFGPEGKRVKVLLTDTRYNREKPSAKADILGREQWTWLEQELAKPDAEVLLVVSSSQVLPFEHDFEKWSDYPSSRQRLLGLLDQSKFKNIVFLSGDRHFGELSKLALPSGRMVWEATSSGLTHSYRNFDDKRNTNSLRINGVLARLNYGLLNIRWEGADPEISMEIRDINKQAILQQSLPLQK